MSPEELLKYPGFTVPHDLNDIYTGCHRRKGPNFGRVFLMLNYTDNNPKHLYPKLNGYGDNGKRSLKL